MQVPFSSVHFLHEECKKELVDTFTDVLDKGWFINGEQCKQFENDFADYCGVKYAVGCGNGMDSITLALMACGIGAGDEVIVPAFTFIASAIAVIRAGATPVFVDVCRNSTLIDVKKIEEKITKKTKAILPVHLYGQPADMECIGQLANKYGLKIIADAAQAHGAYYRGKKISEYADATCFSFYPGKNLGALGDGGAIVTNDEQTAKIARMLTNYGSEKKYVHEYIGFNSRLDEIQAALLHVKLKGLDNHILERKKIAKRYLEEINNPLIRTVNMENTDHVYHIFPIYSDKRDSLKEYLYSKGIETNIHYPIPMHLQKAFGYLKYPIGSFPITEELAKTELSLPIFYGMSDEQLEYVIKTLNDWRL